MSRQKRNSIESTDVDDDNGGGGDPATESTDNNNNNNNNSGVTATRRTPKSSKKLSSSSRHGDDADEEEDETTTAAAMNKENSITTTNDANTASGTAAADDESPPPPTTIAAARGRTSTSSSSSKKRTSNDTNSTTERVDVAGIIKTIHCENFMCHQNFRVDLNRNVTFIHGQNGSGKSAILAAIQICLGANARRTHRARNLKDLVRRDASTNPNHSPTCATVRVTLYNRGSDAYQPEVYGEFITVERSISLRAGGDNGYKLLDHNMVIRSRSKKDLDEMLDTLNIQVENPVAVLDQEEAKKFLTGKAEDKYNFFMKATELERVDQTYASTVDTITELQEINFRVKEGLQTSVDHVETLKRKYSELQELDKLEQKKLQLATDFAWSLYNESDAMYQKNHEAKQLLLERIAKKEDELRQAEEEAGAPGEDGTNKRSRVDELLQEAQHQAEMKHGLETELKEVLGPYKQLERDISSIKKTQNTTKSQIQKAQANLEETRAQIIAMADSAESEEARLTAQLKRSEEELADARGKVDTLKQDQSNWYRKYEELEPHVRHASSNVDMHGKQIHAVQQQLRSLQASSGEQDILALLGSRVATVANMVQKHKDGRKFQGDVIGPIGCYIKVAPGMDEFAAVAEFAIGFGTLDRFIVTNDHDATLLRKIRKQANCTNDCNIFQIDPSPRYSIPGPLDMDGIARISSVFTVENDIVFNCLIDNARMEQKAVARDRKHSQDKLLVKNGSQNSIREKIKEVYLPSGDYWTVKSGSFAMFSNERKLRQTIGVDRTAAIADAHAQLSVLDDEMKKIQREESKLQNEHTTAQKNWNAAKRAAAQNATTIESILERIENVRDEMKASNNQTIDTTELEEDVQQAENLLAKHRATEEKLLSDREAQLPTINTLKDRLEECAIRNAKVLDDISIAERDLTQFLETQTQQHDKLEKKRQKIRKYQDDIMSIEQQIEGVTTHRDDYLFKARTMYFRVEQKKRISLPGEETDEVNQQPAFRVDPTEEELEAIEPIVCEKEPSWYELRLKKIEEKIQKEKKCRNVTSTEDSATVFERYARARDELSAKTDQVHETDDRIEALKKDIEMRRKRWRQFRKHLANSTALKFDEMLSMNKYTGTLEFDDVNRTLDLSVQKNTADSQSESKDVKALSGGERSFTTMALLIALGETLETPFRIFDEFDVCMDAETRKLVIKQLIHVAKSLSNRQFIFITPQDLTGITVDARVRIWKLTPPDRHQNAGGLTQQVLPFAALPN